MHILHKTRTKQVLDLLKEANVTKIACDIRQLDDSSCIPLSSLYRDLHRAFQVSDSFIKNENATRWAAFSDPEKSLS